MQLSERIETLIRLGEHLKGEDACLEAIKHRTWHSNLWFTPENQARAIAAIANTFLNKEQLETWISQYHLPERKTDFRRVGIVMAGNIPLVNFHDIVCTFVAGHCAVIKLSDKDKYLLPYLLKWMEKIHPGIARYFEIVEQLKNFDAVIATGSNNSARYFEAYFGKYPHIIRRNRNAVAVLDGRECEDELHALGKDIFRYFGLGCRNVSKIYVPQGYNFQPLMERLHDFREIILHDKYKNNYDYNLAILILNRTPHYNNGCILLTENPAIASRIAMLHYEFYSNLENLEKQLKTQSDAIQCIVARSGLLKEHPVVPFGKTQEPQLWDYPDGVDVMAFLSTL